MVISTLLRKLNLPLLRENKKILIKKKDFPVRRIFIFQKNAGVRQHQIFLKVALAGITVELNLLIL